MQIRLYEVDIKTGNCTGKKRDYASEELFKKHGIETYNRYNRKRPSSRFPEGSKARICFFNEDGKWQKVSKEKEKELLSKI
jgi:hypothetical protein